MANRADKPIRSADTDQLHRRHETDQTTKELNSVTKITPRRGKSNYTNAANNENQSVVMNWSSDDRETIGESIIHDDADTENTFIAPAGPCNSFMKFWASLPVFDPRNKWRIRWDVILMFFIVINAICVPLDVAVELEQTTFITLLNNLADTFFLIDILVSFRTGYILKKYGNIIYHNQALDVGYKYCKGWFMVDILSVGVPYNLLNNEGSSESVKQTATALGLLKLLRLARIPRLLKRVLHVPLAWKLKVNLLNLVILYIFLCHLLGCGLLVLGRFLKYDESIPKECGDNGNETCTWTVNNGISNTKTQGDGTTYATAFYFSVTTATSVGFGDISATNFVEKFVLSMIMLSTMMVTTILFGSVVTIVDKLGDAKRRYDERTAAIEHFIESYHIEDEAAEPMRRMVEFQWERTKFFDTDAVLEFLPTPLRCEVLLDMNKSFMFTVEFFQDQDDAIIKQIVQVLGHELVLPGTMVVHEGQPADRMYFNRYGKFEMLAPHSYKVVHEVPVGDYFGEIGLLVAHGRYSATVRACEHSRCEAAILEREHLEKLMTTFPVFKQAFKKVGLQRLRSTRKKILSAKFSGQTEYRIVLDLVKGHKMFGNEDGHENSIVAGEVICRSKYTKKKKPAHLITASLQKGKDVLQKGAHLIAATDQTPPTGPLPPSVQLGPIHRTERKRGSSPRFNNVFILKLCCHKMQQLENLEICITMHQCHSWRPNSYIGTVIIYPGDIRLGVVQKQWHRLRNLEQPNECDIICKGIAQQDGVKRKKKIHGQLLLKIVRHRDSNGRDAQLRASQGIRELSHSVRDASKSFQSAQAAKEMKRQDHIIKARAKGAGRQNSLNGSNESKLEQKPKSWKSIKNKFLHKHAHRKKEFADGLQFGAQSLLLDQFAGAKKKRARAESLESVQSEVEENRLKLICSSKVNEAGNSIMNTSEEILKLGKSLLAKIPQSTGSGSDTKY